nr:hypothetical protein Iba_chr07cCG15080 [Ipomoea batatas]
MGMLKEMLLEHDVQLILKIPVASEFDYRMWACFNVVVVTENPYSGGSAIYHHKSRTAEATLEPNGVGVVGLLGGNQGCTMVEERRNWGKILCGV